MKAITWGNGRGKMLPGHVYALSGSRRDIAYVLLCTFLWEMQSGEVSLKFSF